MSNVKFVELDMPGLTVIEQPTYTDNRGFFTEVFLNDEYCKQLSTSFVQENMSYSQFGVVRGLHYQKPPYCQAKLVTVNHGMIIDVVVDLRPSSCTFMQHRMIQLDNHDGISKSLFVPEGFAHGFYVLSQCGAVITYKCSNRYNKDSERCLKYNDPTINIQWPGDAMIISEKDRDGKTVQELLSENSFT
jgi:dTDP-4-dehydrorhamnose 3,5-epimerase